MYNKKIRKTAAFITALSVISANVYDTALALEESEISSIEVIPITEETNIESKEIVLNFKINSSYEYDLLSISKELFFCTDIYTNNQNQIVIEIPENKDISDYILNNNTNDVFLFLDEHVFQINKINSNKNECEIELTEYFKINNSSEEFDISPLESTVINDTTYAPYGSLISIGMKKGWLFSENVNGIYLEGDFNAWTSTTGNFSFAEISNGETKIQYPIIKSSYNINLEFPSEIKCIINGQEYKNEYLNYNWNDTTKLNFDFYINENCNYKIYKAVILNNENSKIKEFYINNNGSSLNFEYDFIEMKNHFENNVNYTVKIETIDDFITAEAYSINEDKIIKEIKYKTIIENGEINLEIPLFIYGENGTTEYIAYSFNKTNFNSIEKINNDYEPLPIYLRYNYNEPIIINYKKINYNNDNVIINKTNKYNSIKNLFHTKISPMTNLLEFQNLNEYRNYISLFNIYYQNDKIYNTLMKSNSKSSYYNFNRPNISCLNIRSILFTENNEIYNLINEPIMFYNDTHSPEINIDNKSSDLWSNSPSYNFTLTADDHELFDADSVTNEEIKEVYNQINGAASDITKIKIGDYEFKKEDEIWTLVSEDTLPSDYSVKITETTTPEEMKNTFDISIWPGVDENGNKITFLEKTLNISVSDEFDNKSESSVSVKLDTSSPILKSLKVNQLKYLNENKYTFCNYGDFSVTVNAFDEGSGVKNITCSYADFKETKNYNNEDLCFNLANKINGQSNDFLKITITDNAGNKSDYYYTKGGFTDDISKAYKIVNDNTPPQCMLSTKKADFIERENIWYKNFCEIYLNASDNSSGLDSLHLSINGEILNIDLLDCMNIENMPIRFEKNSDGTVNATIDNKDIGITISNTIRNIAVTSNDSDVQKIDVSVTFKDSAGNISEPANISYIIDDTSPVVSEKYDIESGNVKQTAFGTFTNTALTVTADINDPGCSSGLDTAEFKFGNTNRTTAEISEAGKAVFTITPEGEKFSESGAISVKARDNVGNFSKETSLLSEKNSSLIIIENIAPVIIPYETKGSDKYTDDKGNIWFSDDAGISFSITDGDYSNTVNSGISHMEVLINDFKKYEKDYDTLKVKTENDDFCISTKQSETKDGKYTFVINASDNAGNTAETKEITVYKDITAPEITEFICNNKTLKINDAGFAPYSYFFEEDTKITVKCEDKNASAGVKSITLKLIDNLGKTVDTITSAALKAEDNSFIAEFTIPEGFKGTVSAFAEDNVNNKSEEKGPEGFVNENEERHKNTSALNITLPETDYHDGKNKPLYKNDINISVSAEDTFSGIKKIEWSLSDYGEDIWKTAEIDSSGKIYGDDANQWKTEKTDKNLVTSVSCIILSSSDMNDKIFRLKITDNAGHVSETSREFSIDKSAPEISVSFDESRADEKYTDIYNNQRSAVVRVKERNFNPSLAQITGANSNGWTLVEGTAGTDSAVYQTNLNFTENGEYSFEVEGTDMCGNKSSKYSSEKFIIDTLPPQLEVTFDNTDVRNGHFYQHSRTAYIQITEDNFDPERVVISGSENLPEISAWSSDGNIHTASVNFKADGEYSMNISLSDKAGNKGNSYTTSFCTDSCSPEIIINGIKDKSANNGPAAFSVIFSDINPDNDSVSVRLSGAKRGQELELKGEFHQNENGCEFIAEPFPETEEYDDIYTLTVSCSDKAKNLSEKTITFSLNRFGSNFIFDESALIIADSYTNNPTDIIIHEINADKLNENTIIKLTRDSENIVLVKDKDYTVSVTGGNGQWYEYIYSIKAENFSTDAAYMITICSEDAAGNINTTTDTTKNAMIKFGVDKTPPKFVPLNIKDGASYRADEIEAEIIVSDNILLNSIDVYLNDSSEKTETLFDGNKCTFTIHSEDVPQKIRLCAADMAGNIEELTINDVLVSKSYARVLFHKTWVKLLGLSAVLLGTAAALFTRKLRKNRQ